MNSHPERSDGSPFAQLLFWRGRTRAAKVLLCAFAILLFAWARAIHAQSAPQPAENFSDRDASTLLRQLSASLQGHSEKQFLALFDLAKMKGGPLFKQQIDSFFSQTESITVHANLAATNSAAETPSMSVDAEMETQPLNGGQATRRNERLTFTVARTGKDWKVIDVQPRGFFSLP
jgi:hypothetical protein